MTYRSPLWPVHALVPARRGSKGLPGKNRMLLGDKPLLAWTIEAALGARRIRNVVLSTDDAGLAELGRIHGALTPFLRPAELAGDRASSVDVALHAADALGWNDEDTLVLLQPTSPFRCSSDIDTCLEVMETAGSNACISVVQAPTPLEWHLTVGADGRLAPALPTLPKSSRRQDARRVLLPNGALYAIRIGVLRASRSFCPPGGTVAHEMSEAHSVDIDDRIDFALAETLLAKGWIDDA